MEGLLSTLPTPFIFCFITFYIVCFYKVVKQVSGGCVIDGYPRIDLIHGLVDISLIFTEAVLRQIQSSKRNFRLSVCFFPELIFF